MSLPAELTCSDERELLLELLNSASAGGTEQQRQDGVAILKRMPAEVVWNVMLELHHGEQQPALGNGPVDQRPIAEQLRDRADALDTVATAELYAGSPCDIKVSTVVEHPDAASGRAATDSSTFSLAQVAKASDQALTPRLGDVQDLDQSLDRAAAEQQRIAVSHRVLAALQQRELAAGGTKALGSMDLLTGSVDVHKSTADFCLVPGSHGEEQAACIATAEEAAEPSSAISCSNRSNWNSAASPVAVQRQHTPSAHSQQGTQRRLEPATTPVTKPAGPPPPRAATASANELRQSAVDGLKSFQLVIRTEGESEDTVSESAYSGVLTPTASPAYSMHTPTAAVSAAARLGSALHSPASSCHTPASVVSARAVSGLPSFSSIGSSSSSRTTGSAQQAPKQKQQKPSAIGLGRAFNALRKSITGRKQMKGQEQPAATAGRQLNTTPAAAASMKQGMTPSSTSRAAAASAAGAKTASPPSSLVQGRLGSFTETERVRAAAAAGSGGSSSRVPAGAGTPASSSGRGSATAISCGYRPPSTSSSNTARAQVGSIAPAAAAYRSPLGKASTTPSAPSVRLVAGSPAPSTSAAAAAASLLSRIPSTGGSAPRTPAAAQSPFSTTAAAEQRTPAAASPAASAGLAWLKQQSEPYSAPVSPCPSRPESVASQYSVASTSKLGATRMAAASGQLPGFAMTKQMVEGKPVPAQQQQLQCTPGAAARPSAALAAAGSRGGYMRQGSSPADALAAAAAAAAASRAGVSRLPGAAGTPASAKGSSRMATASPFAAAGAAAANQRGFGAAGAGAVSRQAVSRCDSHIGLQCAPAAAAAAAGPAGRRAGGGSELRRSRSHGSLAELLQEEKREVSEVRRMWQQRAAEHKQHQLEVQHAIKEHQGKGKERLALRPHLLQQEPSSSPAATVQLGSLSRPTSSTGVSRIPTLGSRLPSAPGVAAAAAAAVHAQPRVLHGPEACESPPTSPVGLTRHSSRGSRCTGVSEGSDACFPAAAGAATAAGTGPVVGASFVQGKMMGGLISRLDEMLQQELPAQGHAAPVAPAATVGTDGINRQLFTE